jgi:drug/metabolite transporter (DMT)-like permease
LALLSGLIWSCASVKLFQGGATMLLEKVFVFVFFALLCSFILVMLPLGHETSMPDLDQLQAVWGWLLLIAIVMFPMTFLTIWPTTLLSPGRVGMLLMADVAAGVISAALLTDEIFGYRELTGTILILSAGIVEVMRQQKINL